MPEPMPPNVSPCLSLASAGSRATATSPLLTKLSPSKVTDWACAGRAARNRTAAAVSGSRLDCRYLVAGSLNSRCIWNAFPCHGRSEAAGRLVAVGYNRATAQLPRSAFSRLGRLGQQEDAQGAGEIA